jgi:ABC-2 type transport system ATP-binding protein
MSVLVKNLTKMYGQQKAVDAISFELKRGDITGFIGPNGSGKSTTMKSICGILSPDSGEILINGKNIAESPIEIKKSTGYLPENNPLYYDMYVAEYLTYVGKIYKVPKIKSRVKEIIQQTGLEPERKKKIGELSKGYKQRVGLAQALIHNPEILILDEPTTGLDPNQLIEIRELIKNISKDKTVLLSTHILQEVEAICHKVIMIDKGKIVADSTTEDVQKGTSDIQVVMVEFKEIVAENVLRKIPGISNFHKQSATTWLIESSANSDIRESVFRFALENNFHILELQTRRRSLEDSFRELSSK